MITLYGKKYARNDKEFVGTLFERDGTANGFYEVTKAGIYFSDMQGNERAFIRRDGLGPVTVTKTDKGARFFMFAASSIDERWLGIPDSYMAEVDGAKELARSVYA